MLPNNEFAHVSSSIHPFPDLSINRKCEDLNAVTKWREDHTIERYRYIQWRKPEDHKTKLKLLIELRRIFGLDERGRRSH